MYISYWISIDEKLPEENIIKNGRKRSEQVLCAIEASTQKGTRYIVKEGCLEDGCWRIPGSQCNVVAWMPMPEYVGPQIKI